MCHIICCLNWHPVLRAKPFAEKPKFLFFASFFSLLGLISAALAIVPEGVGLSLIKAVVSRFLQLVALTIIRIFTSVVKAVY